MLRCSGCGSLVSEFAARCSRCGHGIEDATEIPQPQSEGQSEPASDSSTAGPSLHRRRRRGRTAALVGLAVAVLAAGAIWAGWARSSNGPSVPAALRGLGGQILAESPAGGLLSVDPADGRARILLPGERANEAQPVAIAGPTILYSSGAIVTISGRRPVSSGTHLTGVVNDATQLAPVMPFADDGRAVVVMTRSTAGAPVKAELVDLGDGRRINLGLVDDAAGDPQSAGAFVSVPLDKPRIPYPQSPDSEIALRTAGSSPIVVATVSRLDQDVGWPPTTVVRLGIYPNPTGEAIAVVLDPLTIVTRDVPVVILNRDGGLLAAIAAGKGPGYGTAVSWSTGGRQLAFSTSTANGTGLAVTTETGTIETLPAPLPTSTLGPCTWSPASADIVCNSRTANHDEWLYALPTSNRLIAAPSNGDPLAWTVTPIR